MIMCVSRARAVVCNLVHKDMRDMRCWLCSADYASDSIRQYGVQLT